MDELAKFGHPDARFLDLRFVEIRQIQGEPNQVGSVIRYRVPFAGFGAELRLTKRVGLETLLYQFDRRLADHGQLIFNIAPTKDGNRGLSIYAAFDYKKGQGFTVGFCGELLGSCFRDSCTTWCGIMPYARSRRRSSGSTPTPRRRPHWMRGPAHPPCR